MASEDEVAIILKLVADIGDAQKVVNALKEIQQSELQAQNQAKAMAESVNGLTGEQARMANFANDALQRVMKGMEPTLANFQNAMKQLQAMNIHPTVGPEAFGIQPSGPGRPAGPGQPPSGPPGRPPTEKPFEVSRPRAELAAAERTVTELPGLGTITDFARTHKEDLREMERATREALQNEARDREAASRRESQQSTLRINQEKQFQQLIQERGRAATRGGGVPTEGMPEGAIQKLQDAQEQTQKLGAASNVSAVNIARLVGSLFGFGIGISVYAAAGRIANRVLSDLIDNEVNLERAVELNTATLGAQAQGFQQFAAQTSQALGIVQSQLIETTTVGEQFGRSIGMDPEQLTGLTAVATLLARIRGENVDKTMTQLTQAMNGNAGAAQALGLHLDAAYLAYTRLGGATAEVFNMLDPSTQAWLRYSAAVEQTAEQLQGPVTPSQEFAAATSRLSQEWERFTTDVGPTVLRILTELTLDVATALDAINALAETTGAAFDFIGTKAHQLQQAILSTGLGKAVGDAAGQAAEAVNDKLGITASTTASAVNDTRMEQLKTLIAQASGPINQLQQAREQEIAAAKELVRLRHELVQVTAQEAAIRLQFLPQQFATAKAQNEAQQQEIALRQQLLPSERAAADLVNQTSRAQIAAMESVLPAQREMEDLQRKITQQQILAHQATLPSSRALEDLQNQIELQRIIAEDPTRSWAERQAAMQQGRTLEYQVSRAQEAALRARIGELPTQRAAEDVGTQAQLQRLSIEEVLAPSLRAAEDAQRAAEKLTLEHADMMKDVARTIEDLALQAQKEALEQAAALMPLEFQTTTLTLLSQIAQAAVDAAQKNIEIAISGIQVIFQGAQAITPDEENRIVELVGRHIADIIHIAIGQSNARPASLNLIGAGGTP